MGIEILASMNDGSTYVGALRRSSTDYDVVKGRDKEFSIEKAIYRNNAGAVRELAPDEIVVINTESCKAVHIQHVDVKK